MTGSQAPATARYAKPEIRVCPSLVGLEIAVFFAPGRAQALLPPSRACEHAPPPAYKPTSQRSSSQFRPCQAQRAPPTTTPSGFRTSFEIVDEQGVRFDHFIVYCKDKYWNPRDWSSATQLFDQDVPEVDDDQPLHLTLIPATSGGNVWGKKAYRVFISKRTGITIRTGTCSSPSRIAGPPKTPRVGTRPLTGQTSLRPPSGASARTTTTAAMRTLLGGTTLAITAPCRLGDPEWKGNKLVEIYFWDGVDLRA